MATEYLTCPHCGNAVAKGVSYCPRCGEAVDPALVAELQEVYTTLRQLDRHIASGWRHRSVAELRENLLTWYVARRSVAVAAPTSAPNTTAPATASVSRETTPATAQTPTPATTVPLQAAPAPAGAPAARQPVGPVFSWRAFLAEQAIAIMAYMGGFLLLVATLAFEVGGWQDLSSGIKLAVVVLVYSVFGALGFSLRRSAILRTVGRAYIGVFALMTPLVGLAAYRFELQSRGFSVAGMLCLTAAYAAVIYLVLALRTDFVTYTYLGWTSFVVAALASVSWRHAPSEWSFAALAGVSLVLLAAERLRRVPRFAALAEPALHLALLTSPIALLGIVGHGLSMLSAYAGPDGSIFYSPTAFAVAATLGWLLSLGWSLLVHERAARLNAEVVDIIDWLAAAMLPLAVAGIVNRLGAGQAAIGIALSGVAGVELAVALVLRRRWPARYGLRIGIETLAVSLAACGAGTVWELPDPNWPLVVTLTVCVVVALVIALAEQAPWVLLVSGLFLSLDYHQFLMTALPAPQTQTEADYVGAYAGLLMVRGGFVLALWALGVSATFAARSRRYVWPVLVVALGNALFALALAVHYMLDLGLASPVQTMFVLCMAVFALAALAGGYRIRQPVAAALVTAFFGGVAMMTQTLQNDNNAGIFLAVLGVAVVAAGVRRVLGLRWAWGGYAVALWGTLLGWLALRGSSTLSPVAFAGVGLAEWLLLAVAVVATAAALLDEAPFAMLVPPALVLLALTQIRTGYGRVDVVLALICVAAGYLLRWLRGRFWNAGWHVTGFSGALIAIAMLGYGPESDIKWQIGGALVFAALAYVVALQERIIWVTAATVLYAALAVQLVPPGHGNLVPTLVLTFGYAAVGLALSRWRGGAWGVAFYAAAVIASGYSLLRISPFDAGQAEALLLVFAGASYLIAVLEHRPWAGVVPAAYAGVAALIQPDAHALLPLALSLAAGGLVVSRGLDEVWARPLYVAAAMAASLTAVLGIREPGFESWALLALAVAAYAIAALESRADLLVPALLLGILSLVSASSALGLTEWQRVFAFAALSWGYFLLASLWSRIPWLRYSGAWWSNGFADRARAERLGDPRQIGPLLHEWAGLALGVVVCVATVFLPDAFTVRSEGTQSMVFALVSLAALLWLHSARRGVAAGAYVAAGLVALAISVEARWLGAENLQAFVLAPGSYLLAVGALLPASARLGHPARAGQALSLAGSLVLLLPTLAQSFAADPNWIYAVVLAVEALVLAFIGVGTRSRALVLTSSLFVGVAAIRGAALAVNSGVPIALVIAVLALLLMGLATWLSLRLREATEAA